ncbi:MAG TPA: MnhB domain-containing protein [Gammaproteobacteria bacterium]|nr:hypothetical protein [Xanthomonadales bacterium]MCB1594299.1 hypothetical protein [Xanthomonadales bacterium]HOP22889.1 MnhB domain-containing protein [Gammaproteobacteria bacterium]HPI95106.1 MnhB domain-containing protein [Gammaproteobacteria bacterium]HPQ86864.1 MnhB domain-containing protein [Gammaproteobacteria bacterium]
MTKYTSLLFIAGLSFLLFVIVGYLPIAENPMVAGKAILGSAQQEVGSANIVTSVVLAYRGLDTLGELSILFAAASVVGLLLGKSYSTDSVKTQKSGQAKEYKQFVVLKSLDLLFPMLLVVGMYIIVHGHLTPGGGFQGGVLLAVAFSMRSIVNPGSDKKNHYSITFIEGFAGFSFILIGVLALITDGNFLQPLLGKGEFGSLWSAGTLPLLYLAVGLKVGAELAGLLFELNGEEERV